jgi:predicted component of type VI protein secretion system
MSRSTAAYAAWDRRRSDAAAVDSNLSPELRPLARLVGGKGSLDDRTETVEQYAHENPEEAMAALIDAAEEKLQALIEEREAA